jgi:nucleoid-associated protein YgaU
MAEFEEYAPGGGRSAKKKKWIWIAVGTGVIAIFLLIRKQMTAATAANAAAAAAAATPQPDPAATITGTGAYPADMTGGISGTGMDQTLSTYLAIADQNTAVQMQALNNQLGTIQSQVNAQNADLANQIAGINAQKAAVSTPTPQPIIASTPTTTAHPDPSAPTTITHTVQKGETLSGITTDQYGKQQAYATGIKTVATMNKISNPNLIYPGQKIILPSHL